MHVRLKARRCPFEAGLSSRGCINERQSESQERATEDAIFVVEQKLAQRLVRLIVGVALERFVGLLSIARGRTSTGAIRPLFAIEVQLWIREVTRITRSISEKAQFHWADSARSDPNASLELPAVYCTHCGRAGWLGVANRAAGQGNFAIERLDPMKAIDPYVVALRDRE